MGNTCSNWKGRIKLGVRTSGWTSGDGHCLFKAPNAKRAQTGMCQKRTGPREHAGVSVGLLLQPSKGQGEGTRTTHRFPIAETPAGPRRPSASGVPATSSASLDPAARPAVSVTRAVVKRWPPTSRQLCDVRREGWPVFSLQYVGQPPYHGDGRDRYGNEQTENPLASQHLTILLRSMIKGGCCVDSSFLHGGHKKTKQNPRNHFGNSHPISWASKGARAPRDCLASVATPNHQTRENR